MTTTATLDTNVLPAQDLVERAARAGVEASAVTVSQREVEGSTLEQEVAALTSIAEVAVFGESRWGHAIWGSNGDAEVFERALHVLSNGAFPRSRQRDSLSEGERRQLRDAMILSAHVRARRDVLVSNDQRAYVSNGRRQAIETEFATKVMTVADFEQHLDELESRPVS